jgi:hypothetical protein
MEVKEMRGKAGVEIRSQRTPEHKPLPYMISNLQPKYTKCSVLQRFSGTLRVRFWIWLAMVVWRR